MVLSRRVLADGEEVVYEARPHWLVLGRPASALVVAVVALVAVAVAAPGTPIAVADALVGLAVVSALWLATRVLRWRHAVLAVTTLRVIERTGVLSRRGEEIRLDRIAELTYHQSLLGMLVGAGQVVLETGAGGGVVLEAVRQPARLQSIITDQVAAYQRALVAPGPRRYDEAVTGATSPGATSPGAIWPGATSPGATPPAGTPPVGDAVSPAGWAAGPAGWAGAPGGGWAGWAGRSGEHAAWTDGSSGWWGGADLGDAHAGAGRAVADRLATLADLHRRGLVTDQEYAATRARLLDQL